MSEQKFALCKTNCRKQQTACGRELSCLDNLSCCTQFCANKYGTETDKYMESTDDIDCSEYTPNENYKEAEPNIVNLKKNNVFVTDKYCGAFTNVNKICDKNKYCNGYTCDNIRQDLGVEDMPQTRMCRDEKDVNCYTEITKKALFRAKDVSVTGVSIASGDNVKCGESNGNTIICPIKKHCKSDTNLCTNMAEGDTYSNTSKYRACVNYSDSNCYYKINSNIMYRPAGAGVNDVYALAYTNDKQCGVFDNKTYVCPKNKYCDSSNKCVKILKKMPVDSNNKTALDYDSSKYRVCKDPYDNTCFYDVESSGNLKTYSYV